VSRKARARVRFAAIGSATFLIAPAAFAAGGALQIFPEPELVIWLLVLLTILVIPLNHLLFKPLLHVLDEREERIAGAKARADRLTREAEATIAQYEQAVRETREDAERARRAHLDTARRETLETTEAARATAEREIDRARSTLRESLEEARTTLRADARELARGAASRVLGRPI